MSDADRQLRVGPPTSVPASIAACRARARRLLGEDVFNYFAGGSGAEVSLREAPVAWGRYRLRPRVLVDAASVELGTRTVGGSTGSLASPVAVAPMAFQARLHEGAEPAVLTGAGEHLCVISTRASRRIEEIAAAARGPWWFQVYITADRRLTEAVVGRAVEAGARALVLTGDTPYVGRKARAGRLTALDDPDNLVNFAAHLRPGADPVRDTEQDPSLSTDDIGWLAELSGLPIFVKGVLRGDDARRCVDAGAGGLIVSNHGGRQLDRAVPTALALPEVVAACPQLPVLVDGGIRSGTDVLVALALGARAVLLGRPVAWALADGGAEGVRELLRLIDDDLSHVLGLAGCPAAAAVQADLLHPELEQ